MDFISDNQTLLRASFALGGLLLFWSLALIFPFRKSKNLKDTKRIAANLLFTFGNGIIIRLLIPFGLIQIPININPYEKIIIRDIPPTLWFVIGLVILDMAIYWQHRISHKVNLFWRLHRMHHSDIEFDTSTAGRFHTLEIFFSFIYKAVIIMLFHISVESIIVFEILLNFSSSFNHSNFSLPRAWERLARLFLITPDLHRVHHSTVHKEMNHNFGFSTSIWDRLFGTYLEETEENPQHMAIGLDHFRESTDQTIANLIVQPLSKN